MEENPLSKNSLLPLSHSTHTPPSHNSHSSPSHPPGPSINADEELLDLHGGRVGVAADGIPPLGEAEEASFAHLRRSFNMAEFPALTSRVVDENDPIAMAELEKLKASWSEKMGTILADSLPALVAPPPLKPTSEHVLTPFPPTGSCQARCNIIALHPQPATIDIPPPPARDSPATLMFQLPRPLQQRASLQILGFPRQLLGFRLATFHLPQQLQLHATLHILGFSRRQQPSFRLHTRQPPLLSLLRPLMGY
ncbi:hypothetical protein Salat_1686400 [Sesamum alatum]|uniref:Uncharacterized protein n=1 Tax=Sesamum alatum TaxID=300844 RepID=A0AAE1Y748_9LAMI|nr:hypothetical protein Salat_1686400 [Sesamum alatum]